MPGPLKKQTENTVFRTPVVQNTPNTVPPSTLSTDAIPTEENRGIEDELFIRNGGIENV